jgi:ABC-type transport system involved in multi-copper enzyme maturation permease subunit
MTTNTTPPRTIPTTRGAGAGTDGTATDHGAPAVTLARVIRSEVTKLYSLRSVLVALVIAVLLIIASGVFAAVGIIVSDAPANPSGGDATADPLGGSLTGVSPAMFAVAALGVIAVTSEFTSGTIHTTFAAVPRRLMVLFGKAIALTLVVLPATVAASLAAFLGAKAVLATEQLPLSLAEPGVARAVVGAGLYLTGVALLAAGFGWLVRNTAGALAILLGLLVVVPVVGFFLPPAVARVVVPLLPNNAGTAIMQINSGDMLPPWTGIGVFYLYAAVVLALAVLAVRRRDA